MSLSFHLAKLYLRVCEHSRGLCENQFKGQIIITSEETINDCSMRGENVQRKKTHEGNLMGCNFTSLVNKLFIPIQYLFKTDLLKFTQF